MPAAHILSLSNDSIGVRFATLAAFFRQPNRKMVPRVALLSLAMIFHEMTTRLNGGIQLASYAFADGTAFFHYFSLTLFPIDSYHSCTLSTRHRTVFKIEIIEDASAENLEVLDRPTQNGSRLRSAM